MDPLPSVDSQPATTPENPAINPQPTATKPLATPDGKATPKNAFTPANARLFAAKSLAARRRNADERLQAIAQAESARLAPPQNSPQTEPMDNFAVQRLARVRGQLARLDELMEDETDPQKLDRLASAQSRLAEQERQYAGRPLPGSLRPTKDARPSSILSAPATTAPAKTRVDQE